MPAYDADSDPLGERDFGAVAVGRIRTAWKVNCYDRMLAAASPDPSDSTITTRINTVTLAEEY